MKTMTIRRALALMLLALLLLLAGRGAQACDSSACVFAGPRLASLDSQQATLYGGLLSQMTGSSLALSVADWNALAAGGSNVGGWLDALAAEMGVAGRDDALAGQASLTQVVAALAADARAQGRSAAAAALERLAAGLVGAAGTLRVADLVDSDGGSGGAAFDAVSVGTLDLVTGLVQLYNASGVAAAREPLSLSGESLGLGGTVQAVRLSVQATEPPVLRCGPAGTVFHSAAMRYRLEVDLVPQSPDVSALSAVAGIADAQLTLGSLSLYGETARGSGVIEAIDALSRSVSVRATPGVAALYLGRIADAVFNDPRRAIDPETDLAFAPIGELSVSDAVTGQQTTTRVEARGRAESGAAQPSLLFFSPPYPQTQTVGAGAGVASRMAAELVQTMALRTEPSLGAADAQVTELLAPVLRDSLVPLVETLVSQALDPALKMAGIGLGEMDVTVQGVSRACSLSGHVYHDADHDGRRAADEGATGHVHYAKLRVSGGGEGRVAPVDASGAYRFDAVAPGRYELWIASAADPAGAGASAEPPAGWLPTEPRTLRRGGVEMGEAELRGQDFGLYPGSRIGGSVFRDSGASAHDGRRDADEAGIAGARVELRSADGTVKHDAATSGADGRWSLWLPAAVATPVKIVQRNLAGHLSTGADAGNTGGRYEHGSDTLAFDAAPGSAYAGVHFGDVPPGRFAPDGQQSAPPGSVLLYGHRFVAGSRGTLKLTASQHASPALEGWNVTLHRDADCNGDLDAGDTPITGEQALEADDTLCLVAKVIVPEQAPHGALHRLSLHAAFRHEGAEAPIDHTLSREDLSTVGSRHDAALRLHKRADRGTARPGETIVYTIEYRNDGADALTRLRIFDVVPSHTVFVAADCGAPAAEASDCTIVTQPEAGGSGRIEWRIDGMLRPGESGTVRFSARVE